MFLPAEVTEKARTPKAEGVHAIGLLLDLVASREATGLKERAIDAISCWWYFVS